MSSLRLTNHKLYQCQLLLRQAQSVTEPAALQEALETAALYHWYDAYVAYLHELADMVQWQNPVDSLEQLMQDARLVTGEMRELQHLQEDHFSWLAQALRAVEEAHGVGQMMGSKGVQAAAPGMIPIQAQNDTPVHSWLTQLTQLIDTQRENRQES